MTGGDSHTFDDALIVKCTHNSCLESNSFRLEKNVLTHMSCLNMGVGNPSLEPHLALDLAFNRFMSSWAFFLASRSLSSNTSAQGSVTRQVNLPLRGGSG